MNKVEILVHHFLRKALRAVGYATVREREYDFVFQHLMLRKGIVLDIGCNDSLLAFQLAKMGLEVYGLDIRKYPFRHKNLTFIRGDITDNNIISQLPKFDCISCVSTLEHIGLGFYGDKEKNENDKLALLNMHALLKDNGLLILTLPFASDYTVDKFERVYNYQALINLFNRHWMILEERYHIPLHKKNWVISTKEGAEKKYKVYPKSNNACYLLQRT